MLTISKTDDVNNVLVQSLSHVQLFVPPWTAACQASQFFIISQCLLKLMSRWYHPTISFCHSFFFLSSIFPSIWVFPNELALCIRWPECWSFSFSPSNEFSGLDSFRIDCLALLAVQGTVKSLLQHHSPKVSVLQCSAFFMVQLSHPYMTTGKTISFD